MAINDADKTKLITLGGLAKFFEYLKQYLVEKAFSKTHFSKTKDSNYVPGTEGLIDVKLGRMVDDAVDYESGKGYYNTIRPTNSERFLTNGQTIVNVVSGNVDGYNNDNNTTLNKTGLGQTIPNTFGLTVSNSVFKARGAEIDWTNGRSWDTLNYFLSPGVYTINYKIPKSIPEDKKGSYDTFEKFLAAELGNSGFNGLNLPRTPGEVIQIRLTVTTIFVGSNKERLRVYQQAQIVTSKQDKLAGNLNFHDSGDVYVRIGEGPSSLAKKIPVSKPSTDLPNIFFGTTSSDYIFTQWRSITSSSVTKTYQPKDSNNPNQRGANIKFQDGGVFTLTPVDCPRPDGSYSVSNGDGETITHDRVRNHKRVDIYLPDLSTMSTKKPQKCTLYLYNYEDVINQYIRLYIEQPKLLEAKIDGKRGYQYLSHDVMCSVKLDRYVNRHIHEAAIDHQSYWFTTVQWGQLRNWYTTADANDKNLKYRVIRYTPHYEQDEFLNLDENSGKKGFIKAWGGANGVYKIDITILPVDNMMAARNPQGEYVGKAFSSNIKLHTSTKYYHILTTIEYLGPIDPTFNISGNNKGLFSQVYEDSDYNGIGCNYKDVDTYYRGETSGGYFWLNGSITDAARPPGADKYKFALLEDYSAKEQVFTGPVSGEVNYDEYREDVEYINTKENKK